MTAFADVVIADGLATPVNHTFGMVGIDRDGIAEWTDRIGGIAVGFPIITLQLRKPNKNGARNYKVTRKIVYPVLEITSPSTGTGIQPAPTKAYDIVNISEWILPERSTQAQRKDLVAFAKNFDALALFTNMVNNLENVA